MKDGAILEIKDKLPIIEIIGQYIQIEKAGKNFRAKCPFHNEKTPSFYISEERNSYYCFGCNKKGDIFSFLEEYEGLEFKEALKVLAEKAGVVLKSESKIKNTHTSDLKTTLFELLSESSLFFQNEFLKSKSALEYISNRGVVNKTWEKFQVGFAPSGWTTLYSHLQKKGFSDQLIEQAGLIKQGPHGFYDRFRNRIMFPFFDTNGRVVGFSGRIIDNTSLEAKYINSPDSILFNKGSLFYGLYQAKESIRHFKKVLVVEGQLDVLMTHQAGVMYVVASSGTAFSEETQTSMGVVSHLGILKRLTDRIYFAFDNDSAGIKAMYKATMIALKTGFFVSCVSITEGKDLAEVTQKHGPHFLKILLEKKQDAIFFFVNYLVMHTKNEKLNQGITQKIWPLLKNITSPLEQSRYITHIASILLVPEKNLLDDFNIFLKSEKVFKKDTEKIVVNINDSVEKMFGLVFYLESNNLKVQARRYEEKLKKLYKEKYEDYKESFENKKESLIFLIEKNFQKNIEILDKDIDFMYTSFELDFLRKELYRLRSDIMQDELLGLDTHKKLEEVSFISNTLQKKR